MKQKKEEGYYDDLIVIILLISAFGLGILVTSIFYEKIREQNTDVVKDNFVLKIEYHEAAKPNRDAIQYVNEDLFKYTHLIK